MLDQANASHWETQIKDGRIIGLVPASPPCETWTVVRWMNEGPGMPPVMRTACFPWGVNRLSYKQYQQLDVANQLLRVTLKFFALVVASGGFALLEHPADPVWKPQAASIWKRSNGYLPCSASWS